MSSTKKFVLFYRKTTKILCLKLPPANFLRFFGMEFLCAEQPSGTFDRVTYVIMLSQCIVNSNNVHRIHNSCL